MNQDALEGIKPPPVPPQQPSPDPTTDPPATGTFGGDDGLPFHRRPPAIFREDADVDGTDIILGVHDGAISVWRFPSETVVDPLDVDDDPVWTLEHLHRCEHCFSPGTAEEVDAFFRDTINPSLDDPVIFPDSDLPGTTFAVPGPEADALVRDRLLGLLLALGGKSAIAFAPTADAECLAERVGVHPESLHTFLLFSFPSGLTHSAGPPDASFVSLPGAPAELFPAHALRPRGAEVVIPHANQISENPTVPRFGHLLAAPRRITVHADGASAHERARAARALQQIMTNPGNSGDD